MNSRGKELGLTMRTLEEEHEPAAKEHAFQWLEEDWAQLNTRVSPDVKRRIKVFCATHDMTQQVLIDTAAKEYMDNSDG